MNLIINCVFYIIPCGPEIVLSVRGSINLVRYKLESSIISHFKVEIRCNLRVNILVYLILRFLKSSWPKLPKIRRYLA